MKTKTCTMCKVDKPVTEFNKNRARRDGLQTRCRPCDNGIGTTYYHDNKDLCIAKIRQRKSDLKEWYRDLKQAKSCERCQDRRWYVLQFHHHSDDKTDNVSSMVANGCSRESILAEIAKCNVYCASCHVEVHYLAGCEIL